MRISTMMLASCLACQQQVATSVVTLPSRAPEASAELPEGFARAFEVDIDKPGGLAFDGTTLWVADRVGRTIRGLDPATGEERSRLTAPGPWPTGLAYGDGLLWVADRERNRLFGLDTKAKLVRRELLGPEGPLGLAFDGKHLWVADGRRVHQVSTEDGTTLVSFNAPAWGGEGRGGEQLGLAWANDALWLSDRTRDRIYRLTKAGDVVDILPSPGPLPAGLATAGERLLSVDVDSRRVHALAAADLPAVVRTDPREETVTLRRRITNGGPDTLAEVHAWIAVPSDDHGQTIHGEPTFTPAPTEVVTDQWGQRLAHFVGENIAAGASFEVSMTVRATLHAVRFHVDPSRVGDARDIPRDIARTYLGDASKLAITHPSIVSHTKRAVGDEHRPYWMARRIARHIQDRMHYELAGGWNIAPTVIERGSGSCSEYTFVFLAMCRAAGIPARYVGAVVIRGDDASTDAVFHRWPEIYLPGYGWIPLDAQAGDKPEPEKRAEAMLELPNRFLVTTRGGGASTVLGWDYNGTAKWTCTGRCDVSDLHLGDWYPAREAATAP